MNKKFYLLPLLLFLLCIILSAFKISGSSISIYNYLFQGSTKGDKNLILFHPRGIRSDEWLIETPYIISQYDNNFSTFNSNIGLGQQINTFENLPALKWKSFFQPVTWPLYLFPIEYAFSLRWWFRGILMLIGVYLLLLKLTNKNILFSVFGALMLFFSPYIQWWYTGSTALEAIGYLSFFLFFLFNILFSDSNKKVITNSLLFLYFLTCFLFIYYPPFQISLFYFSLFAIAGYFINNRNLLTTKKIIFITSSIILSISIFAIYSTSIRDVITIMFHTVFPGSRSLLDQRLSATQLFDGFYNILFLFKEDYASKLLKNSSEASNFIFLSIAIIPLIFYKAYRGLKAHKSLNYFSLLLSFYMVFGVIWLLFGFPTIVDRIFLLDKVPSERFLIGLGLADLLLIITYLNSSKDKLLNKSIKLLIPLFIFSLNLYVGLSLYSSSKNLLNLTEIMLISIISLILSSLLVYKKTKAFIISLLIYLFLAGGLVNPLYRGLSPILDSKISKEIKKIENKNKPKKKWVVYDTVILGNYLIANKINSLSGLYLYPQSRLWEYFDTKQEFKNVWNRYGHVYFEYQEDINKVEFNLKQPDLFTLRVNPCNEAFQKLNAQYFIFTREIELKCLILIKKISNSKLNIYIYSNKSF